MVKGGPINYFPQDDESKTPMCNFNNLRAGGQVLQCFIEIGLISFIKLVFYQ